MTETKPYRVIITKSRSLNIILANNNEVQIRTYSHFVSVEEARRFADILEKALTDGPYFDVDRCQFCGKAYARQNRLCLLKDGRIIHKACPRNDLLFLRKGKEASGISRCWDVPGDSHQADWLLWRCGGLHDLSLAVCGGSGALQGLGVILLRL